MWRIAKWTGGVVALLCVALVVAALAGLGDTNSGRNNGKSSSASSRLGSRANPVRFRHAAAVGEGWRPRVLGATRNATRRIVAVSLYDKPEAGGQDYLIRVAATYVGGGKDYFGGPLGLRDRIKVLGRHGAIYEYSNDRCAEELPHSDIEHSFARVFSGHTVTESICFQIASNDAQSLLLFVVGPAVPADPHARPAGLVRASLTDNLV